MTTILFIEDENALQSAATYALEKEGYTILSALDGETGLELAKTKKPDIILLDLILPKKDGFTVLAELKSNDATRDIPIIILSNLESSADVEKALALGGTIYLVKASYSLNEVMNKVQEVLGKKAK
ncbi:MAG: response regulator [Patescibacteria group bacterium]